MIDNKRKCTVLAIQLPTIIILVLLLVSCPGCTKKETLAEIKEAITLDLIKEINADSLESYVTWMQNMGTRFALVDNRREVADAIRNKFIEFGYNNAHLDSFLLEIRYRDIDYALWQYNVRARINGSLFPDSVSIMGAHYDSILSGSESDPFSAAPGAHDNASGVAAALEVARVIKEKSFIPEGSIEFVAFAAEELGLYGSYDYCDKALRSDMKIKMMLNNDMIAYETSSNHEYWSVNIMDYDNSMGLRADADRLAARYTVLGTYNDNRLNRYSDSYRFSQSGYPALFFFKNAYDPNYHSLNDLVEYCNFEYCREIVNISLAMLIDKNR